MSGFETLGLVATVFQTISFGHAVLKSFYDFYHGRPTGLGVVQQNLDSLNNAVHELQSHLTKFQTSRSQNDGADLVQLLDQTKKAASGLKDGVDYVLAKSQPGSIRRSVRTQVRYLWKKEDIESKKKVLSECQSTAQMVLQSHNIKASDLARFEQSQSFSTLSEDVQNAMKQITSGQKELTSAMHSRFDEMEKTIQVLASGTQTIEAITQGLSLAQERDVLEQKSRNLLASLSYPEMRDRENQILDPGEAIFNPSFFRDAEDGPVAADDSLKDFDDYNHPVQQTKKEMQRLHSWVDEGGQLFWVSGHAGSGKSTLMRSLVQREALHAGSKTEILSHYFWKTGKFIQRSARGLLLSVVHQMLHSRKDRLQRILTWLGASADHLMNNTSWTDTKLNEVLRLLSSDTAANTILFIDGLDEMDNDDEMFKVVDLVTSPRLNSIRFCVASRPEWIIYQELSSYPTIHVQDLTRSSMEMYSQRKLSLAMTKMCWDERDGKNLCEQLAFRADGVFMWLMLSTRIVCRMIRHRESLDAVYRRLETMPSKLEDLFTNMWDRMGIDFPSSRKIASGYLNAAVLMCRFTDEVAISLMDVPALMRTLCLLFTYRHQDLSNFASSIRSRLGPSRQQLLDWCADKLEEMKIHCMGLLVVRDPLPSYESPFGDRGAVVNFPAQVHFMHRSVYDYFTATEHGKAILSLNPISYSDCCSRAVESSLVAVRILGDRFFQTEYGPFSFFTSLSKAIEHGIDPAPHVRDFLDLMYVPGQTDLEKAAFLLPLTKGTLVSNSRTILNTIRSQGHLSSDQASQLLRGSWNYVVPDYWIPWTPSSESTDTLIEAGAKVNNLSTYRLAWFMKHGPYDFPHFGTPFTDFLLCFFAGNHSEDLNNPIRSTHSVWRGDDSLFMLQSLLRQQPDFEGKASFVVQQYHLGTLNVFADQNSPDKKKVFAIFSSNACWLYQEAIRKATTFESSPKVLISEIQKTAESLMSNVSPSIHLSAIIAPWTDEWIPECYLIRHSFDGFDAAKFMADVLPLTLMNARHSQGRDNSSLTSDLSDEPLPTGQHGKIHYDYVLEHVMVQDNLKDWVMPQGKASLHGHNLLEKARMADSMTMSQLKVIDRQAMERELCHLVGQVPRNRIDEFAPFNGDRTSEESASVGQEM